MLISAFLLYPIFLMGADKDNFKYHSQLSVLEFYLFRHYESEKCGIPKNTYSKYISWCLKKIPKVNKSNIELHFTINENSHLSEKLIKAQQAERVQLILNDIDEFINDYSVNSGLYYGDKFDNREIKEEDLLELMDLYIHYCLGDKCYIKKDKIKFY